MGGDSFSSLVIDSAGSTNLSAEPAALHVRDGRAAERAILDPRLRFGRVLIEDLSVAPSLVGLIGLVRRHHPITPVYVLFNEAPPFAATISPHLLLSGFLQKSRPIPAAPAPWAPEARASGQGEGVESEASPNPDFVGVPIEEFTPDVLTPFDVYARLGSDRFQKILNASDAFDRGRLRGYWDRGVRRLYVSRTSHERSLTSVKWIENSGLLAHGATLEVRLFQALQSAVGFSRQLAERPMDVELIGRLVGQIQAFAREVSRVLVDARKRPGASQKLVHTFLERADLLEHSVSVATLSLLLAGGIPLTRPDQIFALGSAGLLHDLGAAQFPAGFESDERLRLDPLVRAEYELHPLEGAKHLRKLGIFPEVTLQAIEQHHERRDGSGYPLRVEAGEIHLYAELIGIADEFIEAQRAERSIEAARKRVESKLAQGYSVKAIELFRALFRAPPSGTDGASVERPSVDRISSKA